ncbi:hypothetical protein MUA90_05785 [Staphylococcus sp. IVB6181]|uniref:phage tail spike protein n=1 Tax=Staphylococcus sp. IVB6181 TaxID=2929481 RepID=UPI0021CF4252|nr:phage tail spike protein [Staphylococcus sp. IVB6181]UXV35978.1 hypothetical protein MUA90_05785 [Staphylococcus sp. IVB6181]
MIHVLDYQGKIIDFIAQNDNAVISAVHHKNINERSETFDFTILSERAEHLQDRNRIIIQDSNEQYREFIIEHISQDIDGYTEVETSASYLEDISKSKPYSPGKLPSMTTSQALRDVLKDTGWQVSDRTEYGGTRSTSWTSFQTRYEVLMQLCTTYKMIPDFYVEVGRNRVEGRYVVLKTRAPLFKGKEIVYGKDLLEMKRTVDMTEIKTALLASGPQKEDGTPGITLTVKDDEANNRYSLPGRYLWGIYSPETEDENMTESRLRTLATTELNKRKAAAISYEVKAADIKRYYPHEVIRLGDKIRIKNEDFVPSLYLEAEVIGEDYDLISGDSEYSFGEYKEYAESELKKAFEQRLRDIQQKLNDKVSNINTIIEQTQAGNLEYFEKKIIKSSTPPPNLVNDMLWYDTSNLEVAVLRRYWNGEWLESTVENVEQIGGITREKALHSELNNTFINLCIQHSKLLSEVYEVINSEYLTDNVLEQDVQAKLNDTVAVYNAIKSNLDSMTPETATIGKLVDTQSLFLQYRELLQALYTSLENAKIAIDKYFKLLQSQYTDEKYNEAMTKVANSIGGTWNSDTNQLIADIPNNDEMTAAIKAYTDGEVTKLNNLLNSTIDSKITQTKNELSSNITAVNTKVDNLQVGGRNLLRSYYGSSNISTVITDTKSFTFIGWGVTIYQPSIFSPLLESGKQYTLTFDVEVLNVSSLKPYALDYSLRIYDRTTTKTLINVSAARVTGTVGDKYHVSQTFTATPGEWGLIAYSNLKTPDGTLSTNPRESDTIRISNLKLEKGTIPTDYTLAPEDINSQIIKAQTDATAAAKAYADAQDALRKTETQAYADGIVTAEEERAIADATAKLEEAKRYAADRDSEVLFLAQQDIDGKLLPIKSTQTTQSTDIKQLQDNILLKADKSEVTTLYDNNIKPLETKVNDNTAQLQIQSDKIDSKVSNTQYTADVDNIVTRLNTADTQRTQLSNAINDRVTLTQFNDNKTATTNQINTAVNNIQVGGRNLLLDSLNAVFSPNNVGLGTPVQNADKSWTITPDADKIISSYYFFKYTNKKLTSQPLEKNVYYTFSLDVKPAVDTTVELSINSAAIEQYQSTAKNKFISVAANQYKRIAFTFKIMQDIDNLPIILRTQTAGAKLTYTNSQLEKSNTANDWTPAPEDTQAQITKAQTDATNAAKAYADAQDALRKTEAQAYADGKVTAEEQRAITDAQNKLTEAKTHAETKATEAQNLAQQYAQTQDGATLASANKYTDDKKAQTDQTLTTMQTQINQNGTDINLRATKDEFNQTRKTLSSVISDLTVNTTTGLTLSYDENGNITSSTVGPEGIMLKGDHVDITVNEDFKVMTNAINNKVGKHEVINSINVSNEGIAIDANKVGIRGGDGTTYLDIQNTKLLSRGFFDRTWGDVTDRPYCKLGIYDGHLIMQNETSARNLYLTEKGLSTTMAGNLKGTSGTLEFHFLSPTDNTEGVRLHSYYGMVYLQSQENRVYIRSKQTTNIETADAGIYVRPYNLTRPGYNEFSYKVVEADKPEETDGYFIYGEVSNPDGLAGSGIRFRKKGYKRQTTGEYEPMIYATDNAGNASTGSFSARNFYGD